MDPQAWVWRSIGLAVVVVAAVAALWFMGQVGGALGSIDLATPVPSATASPSPTQAIPSPSASPSSSAPPSPSPTPKKKPSPTPKR